VVYAVQGGRSSSRCRRRARPRAPKKSGV